MVTGGGGSGAWVWAWADGGGDNLFGTDRATVCALQRVPVKLQGEFGKGTGGKLRPHPNNNLD